MLERLENQLENITQSSPGHIPPWTLWHAHREGGKCWGHCWKGLPHCPALPQAEEGLAQLAQGRGRVPGAVGTQTLLGAGSWAQGHDGSPCSGWRLWGPDWPTAAALASCWGKGLSSLCPPPGLTQSCQWKLRHLGLSHSKACPPCPSPRWAMLAFGTSLILYPAAISGP